MTRGMSVCLVICTASGLGACGGSGSGSTASAPAATVASSPPTTPAETVTSSSLTSPANSAALVDLMMTTFKVTNRACVEKAVTEFPPDVLEIVEDLSRSGNPSDNWPDNRALALVHIVQACPNSP